MKIYKVFEVCSSHHCWYFCSKTKAKRWIQKYYKDEIKRFAQERFKNSVEPKTLYKHFVYDYAIAIEEIEVR